MINLLKDCRHKLLAIISVIISGLITSYSIGLSMAQSGKTNPDNLVGHGGPIKAISISADGKKILTGSFDYSTILWQLNKPGPDKLARRYSDHDGAINALAFLPAQKQFLSAGDDGSIYLWDQTSDQLVFRFNGHQSKVLSLAISTDEKITASASWDRTVRLWDIENLKPVRVLKGHKGPVNAVLISVDSKHVFSGSYDGSIIKWSVKTGQLERPVHRHGWGINVMKWLPGQQQILFGTINGDVQIFDLKTNAISKILIPHERPALALAVSGNGKYLASGGGDGIIRVWDTSDWSVVEELNSSFGPVWSMVFSHDAKKIYYVGLDDYAVAWKISPRKIGDEVQGKFPRRFQKFQNMSLGERQFARKCSICHTLKPGDQNRAGPSLFGIFGRVAGTLKGYNYSAGLLKSKIVWNKATIDQLFALGPQHVTPGSKMPLQKISKKEKRTALIKFLMANTQ